MSIADPFGPFVPFVQTPVERVTPSAAVDPWYNRYPGAWYAPPGCVCPPTSEQTCMNPECPRGKRPSWPRTAPVVER